MKISTFLLSLFGFVSVNGIELTPDNWDAETAGKTVFIKFLAPWWGHCKNMKPDWDKLMSAFAGSATQLVADVDCTAAGKPLCESNGVRGYPTIKYGDPSSLEDYQGGRDYASLKKFADENLKPTCGPMNIDLCDDAKKAQINNFLAMSAGDLDALIAVEEKKISDSEELFNAEVQKLQAKYQQLMKDKDETAAQVKAGGLGLMKACKVAQVKGKDEL